jgi:hypothetical protein
MSMFGAIRNQEHEAEEVALPQFILLKPEALMRVDGGKGCWRDLAVQREYGEVLARLAGEAPPLSPAPVAPEAVPMSTPCRGSAAGSVKSGVRNSVIRGKSPARGLRSQPYIHSQCGGRPMATKALAA